MISSSLKCRLSFCCFECGDFLFCFFLLFFWYFFGCCSFFCFLDCLLFVLFSSMEGMPQGWGGEYGGARRWTKQGYMIESLQRFYKKFKRHESYLLTLHTCRFLRKKIFPNRTDYVTALQRSERVTNWGSEQLTAQSIRFSLTTKAQTKQS